MDAQVVTSATTLPELLDERRPGADTPFLREADGRVLTYGGLADAAARVAGVLHELGVKSGDRVGVQVEKSAQAVIVHVALLRLGAVQLPLNPAYTDEEVGALLSDAEPTMLIRDADRAPLPGAWAELSLGADGRGSLTEAAESATPLDAAVVLSAGSPAALLYTSGTTGRPKGALLSHGNLVHNADTLVTAWGFTGDDVLLHVLPLFHTHGLFVATHCVLASGSSMVFLPRFDVDVVLSELASCSVFMGVPTHYVRLLSDPHFGAPLTDDVRLFVSGSAPMTKATHEEFTVRTGKVVLERYGMTETSMLTSNPLDGERRPGTVGPPLPGVDVTVKDDDDTAVPPHEIGHVLVRGPNVFEGYWRRPDLRSSDFTGDGWFRTGDLGRFDDEGYLELVGRSKDLVITGGMNVHPKEVEVALDALEGVAESAVIGLPDDDLGETVVAVVVAAPGATLEEGALRSGVRRQLAGFKVPKRIVVVEGLPRNAMGKVEKSRLRSDLSDPP
ncbi:MAG: AMP-binding protein [Actinomycetes bacterium]